MKKQVLLVMGVAGSGKSTIGQALAKALDAHFIDAGDYHSPENIAHMAGGQVMSDDMRWAWLDAVGKAVRESAQTKPTVFACSALRRVYRDYLRVMIQYTLIYPDAPYDVVLERVNARKDHFMPAKLLRSQYQNLQKPNKDEDPVTVQITQPVADIVAAIRLQLI